MNLKKENYDLLKDVEDKLYTAVYCKFVRITDREQLKTIDQVYKETFHTEKGIIGGCQHCLYEGCKKLGKLYFEDKKAYEAAENKKNAENEVKTEEKEPKTAPKAKKTAKKKK